MELENNNHAKKSWIWILSLLLICCMLLSLRYGSSKMNLLVFWNGLLRKAGFEKYSMILYTIRLPRTLAAVLAGTGLSISGVLLQSVTGNELASPNIIGVNSGAGFAVILLLFVCPQAFYSLPAAAFLGAFGTTLLIVACANQMGTVKSNLVLVGIAFTSVLNAGISFLSFLDEDVLSVYNYFSVGGISGVQMKSLVVPALLIFASVVVALAYSRKIHLLCLGDSLALSLGVRVKMLRVICLICASASAAAVVSFAGLLGFVGLIVPHIARKLVGTETKIVLPVSALTGSILVLVGDFLGRVLFAPSELPVGIMMAAVGAPFFLFLLLKNRKGGQAF